MKKLICLTLVFVLTAGCAGTKDKQRTIGEGTAAGACLGGILGAALGYASGDNEEQRKERAKKWSTIGAGLGVLAGAAFGYHVSEIKAQYIKKEDDLNTRIAKVRRMNNETQKFNTFLWGEIRELDQKIDKMAAQYNSRKLKKSKLVNKKKEVQAKHKEANEILMGLKNPLLFNGPQVLSGLSRKC